MVGAAAESEIHRRPVGQIIKGALDEARTGVVHHHQAGSGVGRVVQDEVHRAAGDVEARRSQRNFSAGGVGEGVDGAEGSEGEVGGDALGCRHVGIGARVGGGAVAPIHEMKVGGRDGGDGGAPVTEFDKLRGGPGERAVGACRVGEGVGVDREVGGDAQVGRDVGVGARVGGGAVAPVHEVVAGGRDGGDRGAAGAVGDRLWPDAGERAVGACGVG